MRKSHFTESQIVQILAEFDAGASAEELGRRHGVHANTIRLWRTKYAGMTASDLARLKQLEAENLQMQRIIARQTVKLDAMEDLIRKNSWGLPSVPTLRRPSKPAASANAKRAK
jgi:putative transposase